MAKSERKTNPKEPRKTCGIIMPISPQRYGNVEYPPEYWDSMLAFLKDAIEEAGYEPIPMWEDDTTSSITPRIIRNINEFPLAVCVISAFNPNVMMELGMRLCTNKPVLVIFDEQIINLPFDIKDLESYQIPTHPIYNQYPEIRSKIGDFLHKMDQEGYKTFVENFNVANAVKSVSAENLQGSRDEVLPKIEKELTTLSDRMNRLENVFRGGELYRTRVFSRVNACDNVLPGGSPDWLQLQG